MLWRNEAGPRAGITRIGGCNTSTASSVATLRKDQHFASTRRPANQAGDTRNCESFFRTLKRSEQMRAAEYANVEDHTHKNFSVIDRNTIEKGSNSASDIAHRPEFEKVGHNEGSLAFRVVIKWMPSSHKSRPPKWLSVSTVTKCRPS